MRNKITFITIFLVAIAGFGAFSKIRGTASNPKAEAHRPYKFAAKDCAELVVTKFIRAIETGNIKATALLMEKDVNYHTASKIVAEFYSKHCQAKAKKYLVLYPRRFIFNDSVVQCILILRIQLSPVRVRRRCYFSVTRRASG